MDKKQFLQLIRSNIEKHAYHVTIVGSKTIPRYAYTIGLSNLFNFELIFAGGIIFLKDDLAFIFETIVKALKERKNVIDQKVKVENLGTFSLRQVVVSWCKLMMLGVYDHYKTDEINAFQIIPDTDYYTLDIPNMAIEWNVSSEPVWQWLVRDWDYTVPENSTVVTNIKAMLGKSITEVTRWENDYWEMFAGNGPEVEKKDMCVVSLGTVLGIDSTLLPVINLDIGKGLWRSSAESNWNNW